MWRGSCAKNKEKKKKDEQAEESPLQKKKTVVEEYCEGKGKDGNALARKTSGSDSKEKRKRKDSEKKKKMKKKNEEDGYRVAKEPLPIAMPGPNWDIEELDQSHIEDVTENEDYGPKFKVCIKVFNYY